MPPKMRLEPKDEYTHTPDAAQNYNESMYFNFYDPKEKLGGFFRIGNRPNEKYAEVTACLYLPDKTVGFMFGRPEISSNEKFEAAGMRFETIEPFRKLLVNYKGDVVTLKNPLEMVEPRQAFKGNPWASCDVSLEYRGVSPMYGGEPVDDGTPLIETKKDEGFAKAHYEQHVGAKGRVRVGEKSWNVEGYGLRDHSWGPRYWQAPWWYRWLTANFGEKNGFMLSIVTGRDGKKKIGGMFLDNDSYDMVKDVKIETGWAGEDHYHETIRAFAKTESGREHEITGKVLSLIPLRNRRKDENGKELLTRISEGMTEWKWNGKTGYGLSEYLDQIVDGKPVGLKG